MKIISRNARSEQYLLAAMKTFNEGKALSDSSSKVLVAHISDIHSDWERLDNAFELIGYFKPDFVIHTGDIVKWNMEDDFGYFYKKAQNSTSPVFNCIGNHDTFNNSRKLTNSELNDCLVAPLNNICSAENGHYYADFEKRGVRLIVINNYDDYREDNLRDKYAVSSEQLYWLCNVLSDAAEKGLAVFIASHECDEPIAANSDKRGFCQRFEPCPWGVTPARPHAVADVVNAFKCGGRVKGEYVYPQSGFKSCADFEFKKNGRFICYLNGHRHGDYAGQLKSYPDQLSIGMTCSGCEPKDYHNIGEEISDLPRVPGTVTEDAVNFYTADLKSGVLTAVRFGAAVNDLCEERLCARFDF